MKKIVLIMSIAFLSKIILIFSIAALFHQSASQKCEQLLATIKIEKSDFEEKQKHAGQELGNMSLLSKIVGRNMICVPYNSGFGTP